MASGVPTQVGGSSGLVGRRVLLRPIQNEDYEYLYDLSTCEENIFRWRFRGRTPSPEEFSQSLWQSVLCQFIVESIESGSPIGLVLGYRPEFQSGLCYIAAVTDPRYQGFGVAIEGIGMLVDYLFRNWRFRKLYAESLEFNFRMFSSGEGSAFELEATLREVEYFDGRLWDLHYLSISRKRWDERTVLQSLTNSTQGEVR